MKISKIEVEGFKSFQEYQSFSFEIDNGLYFVTGENQVEPDLGANGAGKSALFEAVCWCLYGKTSTNLKAGNIVNWSEKGCAVALEFDDGTLVLREQNPNKLELNNNPVTQEELEKHLGYLGFESFLYSTFISQFSSKFFDLSPADKMFVFSDIMAETLHPWELRSIQAKTKAEQTNVIIKNLEIGLSRLQGSLDQLNKTDYTVQIEEFETKRQGEITLLNKNKKEVNNEIVSVKSSIKELMKEKIKLELKDKKIVATDRGTEIDKIREEYGVIQSAILDSKRIVQQKQDDTNENLFSARSDYNHLQKEKARIDGIENEPVCPTCLQPVDKNLLKKTLIEIQKKLSYLEKLQKTYKDETVKLTTKLSELKKQSDDKRLEMDTKLDELQKKIDTENAEKGKVAGDLRVIQSKLDSLSKDLTYKETQMKKVDDMILSVENRENDYIKLEEERIENIKKVTQVIVDDTDILNNTKKEFDAYTYWVKGFKEIRLLLMLESLKEFEISINNNLNKFGMGDWVVKLDIDKENKSGTVRKGFSVLVESPNHNGFVPFEVWSGGEGQRLRLAGTIGLMDLIQSKRQVDFGLEIFDEPTAWLSNKGIDDLLQTLYYRAKENEKKIFLIDHKQLNTFGGFHGSIKIVKNNQGSQIIL